MSESRCINCEKGNATLSGFCLDCINKRQWYHNGTDSLDAPQVIPSEVYNKLGYSEQMAFSNGPFDSFTVAKSDLINQLTNMRDAYRNAIELAKAIRRR